MSSVSILSSQKSNEYVAVGFGVGAMLGVAEGFGDGFAVGTGKGAMLGSAVGFGEGFAVEGDGVGGTTGAADGFGDGLALGDAVGATTGAALGAGTGLSEGSALGEADGGTEGDADGAGIGTILGAAEGFSVGVPVGAGKGIMLGTDEGDAVGEHLSPTERQIALSSVHAMASARAVHSWNVPVVSLFPFCGWAPVSAFNCAAELPADWPWRKTAATTPTAAPHTRPATNTRLDARRGAALCDRSVSNDSASLMVP